MGWVTASSSRRPRRSLRRRLFWAVAAVLATTVLALTVFLRETVRVDAERVVTIHRNEDGERLPPIEERTTETVRGSGDLRLTVGAILTLALALLVSTLLGSHLLRPIARLTEAASRLRKGELHARVADPGDDELGLLATTFNEMAASLEQTERLRRNLVADVAHELRTPLTHIRCRLEAVEDAVEPATPELLAFLGASVDRLTRLVDDLQQLALAESGQLAVEVAATPLRSVSVQAVDLFRATAEARGIELAVEVPSGLVAAVDGYRLQQVLVNLLDNACRHTPQGGKVTVSGAARQEGIELAVTDTGSGIAPDDLPHLFDRFYRADPARGRTTGGAGLGLAIAKALVEAQGGTIEARSRVGEGTTVSIGLAAAGSGTLSP